MSKRQDGRSRQQASVGSDKQLQLAWDLLQRHDIPQAEAIFTTLSSQAPLRGAACTGLAQAALMRGQLVQAVAWADMAAKENSASPQTFLILAKALRQSGQAELAVARCQAGVARFPEVVDLMTALALAQRDAGQLDAAEATYRQAMLKAPNEWALHQNLANLLQVKGDLAGAQAGYERVLALQAGHPLALFELGNLARRQGLLEVARQRYRQALAANPRLVPAWRALAEVDTADKRLDAAAESYTSLLSIEPQDADSWFAFAKIKSSLDPAVAVRAMEEGLRFKGDAADMWILLGHLAQVLGDSRRSLAAAEQAFKLEPNSAEACYLRALSAQQLGLVDASLEAATQGMDLPGEAKFRAECRYLKIVAHMDRCELDEAVKGAEALREMAQNPAEMASVLNVLAAVAGPRGQSDKCLELLSSSVELAPDRFGSRQALCAASQYSAKLSAEALCEIARTQMARFNGHCTTVYFSNERHPGKVLNVAYLSADFRQHSCAYFLEPLWQAHDPAQVKIFAYYANSQRDAMTERLKALSHEWREVRHLEHAALRRQMREDDIDILVDLSGFTDGSRLEAVAPRAAPVQVNWLGYLGTTGLDTMDYRLSDRWVNPPELDHCFTEQVLRIDRPYVCYRPDPGAPEVAPLPVLEVGHVTFGSFNVMQKVSDACIEMWAALMQRVPGSLMLIKTWSLAEPLVRERVWSEFERHGVARERIECVNWMKDSGHHLSLYGRVDIGLDTFPYNGVTTTCESMWMGVPVVSRHADMAASRQGLTLLNAVGLGHLATDSSEAFVEAGAQLASNLAALSELRQGLRARMQASSLLDGQDFARQVEKVYRQIWTTWCKGQ